MDSTIRHQGIVESVGNGTARIRILQATACAGCRVSSRCNAADAKEKTIDVATNGDSRVCAGQQVTVATSARTARTAVWIGFGFPLLLMLSVLAATTVAKASEAVRALSMLASLLPYYACVWALRNRIGKSISFVIETDRDNATL